MEIKKIENGFKPRIDFCRNKENNITGEKRRHTNRWKVRPEFKSCHPDRRLIYRNTKYFNSD